MKEKGEVKMRYIQAAVSNEDHTKFANFAFLNKLTFSELIEVAVKKYIENYKEEGGNDEVV